MNMAVVNGTGEMHVGAHSMGERFAALVLQASVDGFKRLDASTLAVVYFLVEQALAKAHPESKMVLATVLARLHAAGANAGAAH